MIRLKLKELLDSKEKTMYWLSKQTGISPNNISKLVNNETTSINFDTLEKIYFALDCKSFEELMEIKEDK